MSKVIYKYPLSVTDEQVLNLPVDAQILSVQVQRGEPCLWALVRPSLTTEVRTILMYGTGHPIVAARLTFIDAIQLYEGQLVFHVFEER